MPPKNAIHILPAPGQEVPGDPLRNAIDSMAEGFALFGPDDRLIFCNEAYLDFNPLGAEFIQPGVLFEDIIRENIKRGNIADATGNKETYLKNRLKQHRNPKGPIYRRMFNGSSFILNECRTPDGSTLLTTTNVTELREIEEELRESEALARQMLEASPVGVLIVTKDGTHLFANERALEIQGITRKELFNSNAVSFYADPSERERIKDKLYKTGNTPPTEVVLVKPDGAKYMVTLTSTLVEFENQKAHLTYLYDITERKKTEAALKASEERLTDITEAALDHFWEMGPDLRFSFVSDNFLGQTGTSSEVIIGKTPQELVGPKTVKENPGLWKAHQKDLEKHLAFRNFEFSKQFDDGNRRFYSVSGKPFFDKDGNFMGYRGAASDLTDYRRSEQELTHHKKMESLGYLAGGMAHNLNNMLLPILILGQMTKDNLPEESRDHQNLEIICRAAANAQELVARISGFSRQQGLDRKSADIYEIIRDGLSLIASIVPPRITLKEDLDKNTGSVYLDSTQTQTVLINLIANAVDAMGGKEGALTVTLRKALVEDTGRKFVPGLVSGVYAKLSVTDTGHGMEEETMNKIFDPFFTTKEVQKGTGLGLSTAFGTIHKHGGTIRAFSTIGKGTTFEIYLPLEETLDNADNRRST